jgi:hypothetical protein
VGDSDGDGGEVEDSADAGGDEFVGDALRGFAGDAHDGEFDVLGGDDFGEIVHGFDGELAEGVTGFVGVGVENGGEAEAFAEEAAVGDEGAAEVTGADEEDVPDFVGAEDFAELGDELIDAVADAGVAELAEVGEVFADLGVGVAKGVAELFGRDGVFVGFMEGFELAQVETEAVDGGSRDVLEFHGFTLAKPPTGREGGVWRNVESRVRSVKAIGGKRWGVA